MIQMTEQQISDIEEASYFRGYLDASKRYDAKSVSNMIFWMFFGGIAIGASMTALVMSLKT